MDAPRYNPMDIVPPPKFDVGVEILDSTIPRVAETYVRLLGKMERGEWLTEDEARMFFRSLPRCVGSMVAQAGEDADDLMVYQAAITNLWFRVKKGGRFDFVDREEMIGPLRRMLCKARMASLSGIKPELDARVDTRDYDIALSELSRLDREMESLACKAKDTGRAWATTLYDAEDDAKKIEVFAENKEGVTKRLAVLEEDRG